jgi:hypothetical protein
VDLLLLLLLLPMLHQVWQQAQSPLAKDSQTASPLLDTSTAYASPRPLEPPPDCFSPLPQPLLLMPAHY